MSLLTLLRSAPVAAGVSDVSLQAVAASCVFDLDATMEGSYGGSGTTWANLVASPADGAAQTAYDFTFGDGANSGTYPTFNGTAGDSAAYFSFDGGDYFTCAETITAFTENVSKTTAGQPFTIVACHRFASTTTGHLLSCHGNTANTEVGVGLVNLVGGPIRYRAQFTGVSSAQFVNLTSAEADPSAGDNVLAYMTKNATTGITVGSYGGENSGTVSAGGTSDFNWKIGARADLGEFAPSGFRIYSIAVFNEVLDADQLAAVKTALGARHGRTYL